ncbi:hypothetical protein X801_09220 [Opisthorchis viverrini]|uniref:Uncharacterized protein n=1 Tax=Opisthorchis viverrini TaxID=6198 RepID=A0A1S8WKL5_OPIVI|nr:hypothetical protein X801_09220 [Opisthorchis viverrini]
MEDRIPMELQRGSVQNLGKTISVDVEVDSHLVLTYDSTEDHLTSATMVPTLSYPYSTHCQLSAIDDIYSVDSGTDCIFSTADIQNNNQTNLERYGTIPDMFHKRNIWTEGLEWPEEELFVIHSNPQGFQRQFDLNGKQGRTEFLKNSRKHDFGLKPNIPLKLTIGKGPPVYDAQTNDILASIGDRKQSSVVNNSINYSIVNSQLVKKSSDPTNPTATLHVAISDPKREKRIREYLKKYFPREIQNISEEVFKQGRDGCNESKGVCQGPCSQRIKDPRPTRFTRSLERTVCFEPLLRTISKHRLNASEKQSERELRKPERQQQKLTNVYVVHKKLTEKTQDSNDPKVRRHNRVTIAARHSSETLANDKRVGFRNKTANRIRRSNLGDLNTTANSEENRKSVKCLQSTSARMEPTNLLKTISTKFQLEKRTYSTTPLPKQNGTVFCEERTRNCVGDLSLPALGTIKSNGFADKISQVNRLQEKLEKIRRQIKQLQNYNNVGRVFCMADTFIRILCAQLAPHILKAAVETPCYPDLRSKNRRFASVNLIALPRSFVDSILQLKAPWKDGKKHLPNRKPVKRLCLKEETSAISILDEESESVCITKLDVSDDNSSQSALFKETSVHPQMATSRESQKTEKYHRGRIGKLCHLMALPSWEQKYMGLRRNKRISSAIMLAWKDTCAFGKSHSGWLRYTAQGLIKRRDRHNKDKKK